MFRIVKLIDAFTICLYNSFMTTRNNKTRLDLTLTGDCNNNHIISLIHYAHNGLNGHERDHTVSTANAPPIFFAVCVYSNKVHGESISLSEGTIEFEV